MMGFAAVALVLGCAYGLPSEDLDKPHKWVPAEQCTFVNPPRVPYYWDEKCAVESLGCWADGVHNQCRFCGEAPYTGLKCPEDAIVPNRRACAFDNPPIVPFYWEPTCEDGMLGCFADGHNLGCRYCGHGIYENVSCPTSVCSFVNEPVTPYYWDTLCQMGMLGCNADGIHVQCRFCDFQPFNAIQCPESARPTYEDGDCWFPMGTAQTHKWNPRCQWGILGCWADGVHRQCQYCGPGSDGIYEGINCTDDDDDDRRLHGHEGEAQKGSSVVFP